MTPDSPAAGLATCQAGGTGGTRGSPDKQRRPYTTADVRFVVVHYPDRTAAYLARQLGRTVGSIRQFIARRPELKKQGRP